MFRVGHPGQAKVTDLEITGCVQQEVAGLEISVKNVSRVDVLQSSQYLVEEVADVIIA